MKKSRLLVVVLFVICIFLYVNSIVLPLTKGYEYFTEFAADLINKKQRLPSIRSVVPPKRFEFIKQIAYLTGIILCGLFALAIYYATSLSKYLIALLKRVIISWGSFISAIRATDRVAKFTLILTIFYLVVQSLWYMNELPFLHDEAYTISNFILPGPLASISFYPYPNNHILFSLLSYPFSFLPVKPEIAYRLPSLIAVVFTCLALFRLLLLFLKGHIAALGVVMFICMLPVMNYAIFARGYSLVFLFSCLSIFALIRIIEDPSCYHYALLVLFSILGLYTIPSYMYPFATIYTIAFGHAVLERSRRIIFRYVVSGLICSIGTLILYLPVIITSGGWKDFLHVLYFGYDHTSTITKIRYFIDSVYALQFFENNLLVILFFLYTAVAASVVIKKNFGMKVPLKESFFFCICLLGFLTPLISFLLQRKMIAPRTHSYAAVFFVGFIFISIKQLVNKKWRQIAFIGITAFIITMNIAYAHRSILLKGEAYNDKSADIFAQEMLKGPKGSDTCYTFDIFYLANIQLKYAFEHRPLFVYQSQPGSPSSATFDFNNKYNWIITMKEDFTLNRDSLNRYYVAHIDRKDAVLWKRKYL